MFQPDSTTTTESDELTHGRWEVITRETRLALKERRTSGDFLGRLDKQEEALRERRSDGETTPDDDQQLKAVGKLRVETLRFQSRIGKAVELTKLARRILFLLIAASLSLRHFLG